MFVVHAPCGCLCSFQNMNSTVGRFVSDLPMSNNTVHLCCTPKYDFCSELVFSRRLNTTKVAICCCSPLSFTPDGHPVAYKLIEMEFMGSASWAH